MNRETLDVTVVENAVALVYTTERALGEHGNKLSAAERSAIERALSEAKDALNTNDLDRIRRAQDELQRGSTTLADAMQRQPSAGRQPPEGEVVDAELVDDRSS